MMATPAEIFANGEKLDEFKKKSAPINEAIEALVGPYRTKLYDERVALLTPEVQAVIRKAEKDRTAGRAEDRGRLFPRAAHRSFEDQADHAAARRSPSTMRC